MLLRKRLLAKFSFILAAVFWLSMPQAWAQTAVMNLIAGVSSSGYNTLSASLSQTLGTYTADSDATITQIVVQLDEQSYSTEDFATTAARTQVRVGGTNFTFSQVGANERATFIGSKTVESGDTGTIVISCSACGSAPGNVAVKVRRTNASPTGWNFTNSGSDNGMVIIRANVSPVIGAISNQQTRASNLPVSLTPVVTGNDEGDTLTWSATNLPSGLTIDVNSGVISGTTDTVADYTPEISVTDGTNTNSRSFAWSVIVNNAPVMSSIGAQTGTIGTAISITPMASDADSDSVTWSASGLPSNLSINPTTGAITGTPDTNQAVSTTVSIDDGYGGTDSETFSFTIANTAPVLAAFGDQASTSGVAVSLSPSASDVNGDTLSWSATDLPSGLSIDTNTGAITGTPDTVAGYTTIIEVADGNGGTDSESVTWNVVAGNSAPMVTPIADREATIGEAVSFTPAASDANDDTISYAASGLPTGLAINTGTGAITGTPSSLGIYNVTITVSDPDEAESSTAFVWTISEVAAATQSDDNEIPSTPSPDATIMPMIDSNVREMFDITRQSIVPVIRMSSKIGLSRLAELRENTGHNRTNRSSHNIQLAFNDKGLQQVADGGFNAWTDELANFTSDFVLPEGMAAWSRTQSIMGSLKTASSEKSVDIDGNNITFGIDYRYTPELTLGGFYQRANSETQSNSQNAETDLNSGLFMIYGSYQLAPDYYLQGGVGTGKLEFEIDRTINGDDYSAQRNGEKSNWMLALSRQYQLESFDLTLSLDSAYQSIELDGYRESSGMATYQYLKQEMRTYYVGGSLLFAQQFQNELGVVNLTGEIGYQADMSDDTVARAFLLADPSTVYEYRMDADDDEQSLSHSSLVLGASLLTDNDWAFNASADFFVYESGTLTGLTLSAARRF